MWFNALDFNIVQRLGIKRESFRFEIVIQKDVSKSCTNESNIQNERLLSVLSI